MILFSRQALFENIQYYWFFGFCTRNNGAPIFACIHWPISILFCIAPPAYPTPTQRCACGGATNTSLPQGRLLQKGNGVAFSRDEEEKRKKTMRTEMMSTQEKPVNRESLPSTSYISRSMPQVMRGVDLTALLLLNVFWVANITPMIALGGLAAFTYWVVCGVLFLLPCMLMLAQLGRMMPVSGSFSRQHSEKASNRFDPIVRKLTSNGQPSARRGIGSYCASTVSVETKNRCHKTLDFLILWIDFHRYEPML